jgi:hypothetical protein
MLLGDDRLRCDYAAADQVPACQSLDFKWTPSCVHIVDLMRTQFRHAQKFDLRRTFRNVTTA